MVITLLLLIAMAAAAGLLLCWVLAGPALPGGEPVGIAAGHPEHVRPLDPLTEMRFRRIMADLEDDDDVW